MNRRSLAICLVLASFVLVPAAMATPLDGGFIDGSSFVLRTANIPAYNWDFFRLDLIPGGNRNLELNVFRESTWSSPSLSAEGWANGWYIPAGPGEATTATMYGPDRTTTLYFDIAFTGDAAGSNVDFWWTVYDCVPVGPCQWVETTLVHLRDGGISWEAKGQADWDPGCGDVPEPTSIVYLALLGIGVAGAGISRRLRRS